MPRYFSAQIETSEGKTLHGPWSTRDEAFRFCVREQALNPLADCFVEQAHAPIGHANRWALRRFYNSRRVFVVGVLPSGRWIVQFVFGAQTIEVSPVDVEARWAQVGTRPGTAISARSTPPLFATA